ncbi:MAG TPA: RsmE family RNA methyltransferase [Acidimicrobiales bacterium]
MFLRSSSAHVFVADLDAPVLDDDDAHHLGRVLRLKAGEPVSASDGAGSWRPCTWAGDGRLDPAGEVVVSAAPAPEVGVGFAPVKGDRPEWVVQKLTEVGVDRIVVVSTARGVVRWEGDRAARHVERLRRVAREAAMQSRRVRLPSVEGVVRFSSLVAGGGGDGGAVAVAEPGGAPPSLECPMVLVGPEGGWSEDELTAGAARVDLGPTVLRAETAAVAAGVLLCALRARLVGPCPI